MDKLKFAIIGCGRIAQRHAEHINNQGELVAVCDIKKDVVKAFGEKHGARPYSSIDELLGNESGLDVVTICSPNGMHAEHTIKALKSGFHVVCEKPMAISGPSMRCPFSSIARKLGIVFTAAAADRSRSFL